MCWSERYLLGPNTVLGPLWAKIVGYEKISQVQLRHSPYDWCDMSGEMSAWPGCGPECGALCGAAALPAQWHNQNYCLDNIWLWGAGGLNRTQNTHAAAPARICIIDHNGIKSKNFENWFLLAENRKKIIRFFRRFKIYILHVGKNMNYPFQARLLKQQWRSHILWC